MDFKYIVAGCGIMGSAAAMHLAASSKAVALIGPSEALADTDAAVPKASHHDEGRITRMLDADIFWSNLARRSIERYEVYALCNLPHAGFAADYRPDRQRQDRAASGRKRIRGKIR